MILPLFNWFGKITFTPGTNRNFSICSLLWLATVGLIWFPAILDVPLARAQQVNAKESIAELEQLIEAHLKWGEFPLAQQKLDQLPATQADQWRVRLFRRQLETGVQQGSVRTLNQMSDDRLRTEQFHWMRQNLGSPGLLRSAGSGASERTSSDGLPSGGIGNGNGSGGGLGGPGSAPLGGITQQDFFPLINLITSTIAVDSWSINGGVGNLQAYPAGVFVDSSGVLKSIQTTSSRGHHFGSRIGLGAWQQEDWFYDQGNRDAQRPSRLRKISLTRLERAAQWKQARGESLDPTMLRLAGLTSIDYVICDPVSKEILLVGPAGPWQPDSQERLVNQNDGSPLLHLDDLVVCLRNAYQHDGKFGCSIEPRGENLVAVQQFIAQSRLTGSAWSEKLRQTLGQQDILVFGIDPTTRTAATLVYADYHMKRIAMGLEPSVAEVPDYLQRMPVNPAGQDDVDVARWWFALKELQISTDDRRQFYKIDQLTLQVLSETEFLNRQGQRIHTENSLPATSAFATDFSRHFAKIAGKYTIYQELRNVFLLATVANLIRQEKMDQQVGWHQTFFGLPVDGGAVYQLEKFPSPLAVDSIMNERQFRQRLAGKTIQGRVVGVSGGVDCQVSAELQGIKFEKLEPSSPLQQVAELIPPAAAPQWWWD